MILEVQLLNSGSVKSNGTRRAVRKGQWEVFQECSLSPACPLVEKFSFNAYCFVIVFILSSGVNGDILVLSLQLHFIFRGVYYLSK